jgi:hypothetical protein
VVKLLEVNRRCLLKLRDTRWGKGDVDGTTIGGAVNPFYELSINHAVNQSGHATGTVNGLVRDFAHGESTRLTPAYSDHDLVEGEGNTRLLLHCFSSRALEPCCRLGKETEKDNALVIDDLVATRHDFAHARKRSISLFKKNLFDK